MTASDPDGEDRSSLIVVSTFLVIIMMQAFIHYSHNHETLLIIRLDIQDKPSFIVEDRYLSFGIDTVLVMNGTDQAGLASGRLRNLAKLLSPSRLRLGGTMSDRLIFTEDYEDGSEAPLPYFFFNGAEFLKAVEFSDAIGARLLFDLNALLRNETDWDSSNAEELLKFAREKNIADKIDWQLGNEPNSFPHVFNVSIPAEQLTKDYIVLRKLMRKLAPNSLLVGPDTTRPQPKRPSCLKYMKDFLTSFNGRISEYLDAISWHQYYLNGHIAVVEDFWNPDTFDLFVNQIKTMRATIDSLRNNTPMWLTETGSAYGGGAPDISNTFSASPLWIHKLGLSAENGITVVIRQSLIGANYAMIDRDFNPLPDYWVALLYKRLVGRRVIAVTKDISPYQLIYCHCTPETVANNSVTIFGVNLEFDLRTIQLIGSSVPKEMIIDEYLLTADSYTSKDVRLNGEILTYNDSVPIFKPRTYNDSILTIPESSIGFWVLRDVNMPACSEHA